MRKLRRAKEGGEMGIIMTLSYTVEVSWCDELQICFLVLKKDGVVVATTPPQQMNERVCQETLDVMAVLHDIPVDEHGGLVIQLESAFREHAEAARRRVVTATPLDRAMVDLTSPILPDLIAAGKKAAAQQKK